MRVLLSTGYWQHKTNHHFSKRICEIYPEAKIGVYGGTLSLPFLQTLLLKDNDIKYEIFNVNDIHLMETELDYDELKRFEENLPNKSLWRVISTNRGIEAFSHGSVGFTTRKNVGRENLLREFSNRLRKMRIVFESFSPDLYHESPGMDGCGAYINQQLCKERNIPYLVLQETRVKSYFSFSDSINVTFPQINKSYLELLNDYNESDKKYAKAEELYSVIMNELENPIYFDRMNSRFNFVRYDTLFRKLKWFGLIVFGVLVRGIRKPSFRNLVYFIKQRIQKLRYTDPKLYDKINYGQKYLYYTLHGQPEYAINVMGTMWMNQINNIEILAKSVPADWLVYVKEHPGTITDRLRPYNYPDKIRKFPNVRLVHVFEDMHKLISNAQMVVVVNGTAGWEAVQRGVPTISFSDNLWDILGLSRKCADVEALSNVIYDEVKRIKKISIYERKKRIVCYLAAILQHSIHLSYPNEYGFSAKTSDEQYEVCGRELADGLIKHLDYLEKEEGYCFR